MFKKTPLLAVLSVSLSMTLLHAVSCPSTCAQERDVNESPNSFDAVSPPPPSARMQLPVQAPFHHPPVDSDDPDTSPEMQVKWDAWHKRVAEAVYIKYSAMADAAFAHSRPLACSAAYVVTNKGQIKNLCMLQKSPNIIYNALVMTAIQTLNGKTEILQFPEGSQREEVQKSATFTQNYGPIIASPAVSNDGQSK